MEILKSNLNFIRVNLPVAILNNLKKSYLVISKKIFFFFLIDGPTPGSFPLYYSSTSHIQYMNSGYYIDQ